MQTAIDKFVEQWRIGGPHRAFGVFDSSTRSADRFIETNLELLGNPVEVNLFQLFGLAAEGALACLLPGIRASQIDPRVALNTE